MADLSNIISSLSYTLIWLTGMSLVFIIVVSMMPQGNPLRDFLMALSARLGATIAVGALALPVELIPGADLVFDVAAPVGLGIYWLTLLGRLG